MHVPQTHQVGAKSNPPLRHEVIHVQHPPPEKPFPGTSGKTLPRHLSRNSKKYSPTNGETGQIDLTGLSFRQQAALPAIAAAPSLVQAAHDAGIEDGTLRRWLREPQFAECLAALRQQSVVLAREELSVLARRGMAVFADAMEDPDPAIRLRAARYALSHAASS